MGVGEGLRESSEIDERIDEKLFLKPLLLSIIVSLRVNPHDFDIWHFDGSFNLIRNSYYYLFLGKCQQLRTSIPKGDS